MSRAKKTQRQALAEINDNVLPTQMMLRLSDGRVLTRDQQMWLWMRCPMQPIREARTPSDRLQAAEPLILLAHELATMTRTGMVNRRRARKNHYREIQVHTTNVPRPWTPDPAKANADYLADLYHGRTRNRMTMLVGVRLIPDGSRGAGLKGQISALADLVVNAGHGQILDEFDTDFERVRAAMVRSGFLDAAPEDLRHADSWWSPVQDPGTPFVDHTDHLHFFDSLDLLRGIKAENMLDTCRAWGSLNGQHPVTFCTIHTVNVAMTDPVSDAAAWAASLFDHGAQMVSIRAKIEPATTTRQELRSHKAEYIKMIEDRAKDGALEKFEQDEKLEQYTAIEAAYAKDGAEAPATLIDVSGIVAFDGVVKDIETLSQRVGTCRLLPMTGRQPLAWRESLISSRDGANPLLHDWPIQTLACAGLGDMNRVGDTDGAVLGFTERGGQEARVSPSAASSGDSEPIMGIFGTTGSGKTLTGLKLASEWARAGSPVVIIDPKTGSDHSDLVLSIPGSQVYSLDNILETDGIFDPIRFSHNPIDGVETAASMLLSVDPWGGARRFETDVIVALTYGVQHGATCIGQALQLALQAGQATEQMVQPVLRLAASAPKFSAMVGRNPHGQALSVAPAITLIKVGAATLELPPEGTPLESCNQQQRIAAALVRMMVYGSAVALTDRSGAVMLDEAWVFMQSGKAEVLRLGRLARSQNVLPVLMSQRVSDATDAGLHGFMSRTLILPIKEEKEALAALTLANLDPDVNGRLARITAAATMGSASHETGTAPNWSSMRALWEKGQCVRGTIALYQDLHQRAINVEVTIPDWLLLMTSTRKEHIDKRRRWMAAGVDIREMVAREKAGLPVP